MTARGRWTLAILTAALIAAAIYVSSVRRTDRSAGVGELLYPALEASLDDVAIIRIKVPGGTTAVTLERAKGGWLVAERGGYPADAGRVKTLLLGLAQARMLEQKSSLAANYPPLGVEDLSAAGATGIGVELEGPASPLSLIVGKSPDARSTFVRRAGDEASWQIGTALSVERDPAKWLATELLDIGANRIQSAEYSSPGKRSWSATKASRADLDFTVKGKPSGSPDSGGSADRFASALAGLRLSDVRPASDPVPDKAAATATYRTFDGLVLSIDGYTDGDKRHIRVRPAVDEVAARPFFVASAPPESKDAAGVAAEPAVAKPPAARTPESMLAEIRAEATKLDARLDGWSFEIPSWNYDAIFP